MSEQLVGALIGLGGAVFGVLVAAGVSLWTHTRSVTRETAEDFHDVLEKLLDTRIQTIKVVEEHSTNVARREALGAALNAKRQLYMSTANRILRRASDELTANDYLALGFEYQQDSEFETAEKWYLTALQLPEQSNMERVAIQRSLGGLYLSQTVLHDRVRGEKYFRDALELTNGQTDDNSRYTTGYTHEFLGMALMANRYPEWKGSIDSARENYEAMSPANVVRQWAIDSLNLRLQQTGHGVPVPPPQSPPTSVPTS